MTTLIGQLVTGIGIGSVLLLIAIGLALTFGQMGVINFAHGEFMLAGAYTVYVLQGVITDAGVSVLVALPVAFVVAGLLGLLLEVTIIHRLYGRPLDTLLVTWGVSLILQQAARDLISQQNVNVDRPSWLSGGIDVLGVNVSQVRLFIFLLAVLSVAALAAVLQLTPLGRRIRAVVQNRDLAECSGVSSRWTDRATFIIGSGLAGVAGVAVAMLGAVGPVTGTAYIVDAFLVVIVGGLGQIRGAVIMAFALGVFRSLVEFYGGEWLDTSVAVAQVIVFVAVVAFLQFRPQGLITVRTRSLA